MTAKARAAARRARVGNKPEIAAVCGVDVDAETVSFLEFQDLVQRIDGADGSGAQGDHDGSHAALAEFGFEGVKVEAAARYRLRLIA